LELQRELGGNPDVDVAYQYLTFFMDDDDELARIAASYRKGEMLTAEVSDPLQLGGVSLAFTVLVTDMNDMYFFFAQQLKQICIKHLQEYVAAFQQRRSLVTDDVVKEFMSTRKLVWRGNPKAQRIAIVAPAATATDDTPAAGADGKLTKSQLKKLEKEKMIAAKKAAKAAGKAEDAAA
jgi:tryptophanyl-tRNA synthetase